MQVDKKKRGKLNSNQIQTQETFPLFTKGRFMVENMNGFKHF